LATLNNFFLFVGRDEKGGNMKKKTLRHNIEKIKLEIINYLLANENSTIKKFCAEKKYDYHYIIQRVNSKEIYKEVNSILKKKAETFREEITKKIEEKGKEEAHFAINLRKYNDFGLKLVAKKLQEKIKIDNLQFRNDAEILRLYDAFLKTRIEIEKLILDLEKEGKIEQQDEKEKYSELYSRLDELINFKNENNNNNNLNIDDNIETKTN